MKNANCKRYAVKEGLLTTTSKPKMVRSSFLASQFAASVTSSRSKELILVLKESAPAECPVLVGRDFKLQRVSTTVSKLKYMTLS